jgi:hypothetical protein
VVDVPARTAIALEGRGAPNGHGLERAIRALFGIAYTLKFGRTPRDFTVGPLEVRWWTDEGRPLDETPREAWRWLVRLAVPDDVSAGELLSTVRTAVAKKRGRLAGDRDAERVQLERIPAQKLLRLLHVGPYSEEARSFARLRTAAEELSLALRPGHLEVYLNDPRRTAPERLKTVLLVEVASPAAERRPACATPLT